MAKPSPRTLRRVMNVWPPFLFSGIRVLDISDDWRRARVELRRHWYNRNYVGTHFGGSLFAMTDPFWMVLMMNRLGDDYLVWDRAAEIEFLEATREPVHADFHLDDDSVAEVRAAAADGTKHLRWFETEVRMASGTLVARVRKQLYVRRKSPKR